MSKENLENITWPKYKDGNLGHQVIKSLIATEVQRSKEQCTFFRVGIIEYLTKNHDFSGSGNAYEFECRHDGFYIDCLYPNDSRTPVIVDYDDILSALTITEMIIFNRNEAPNTE
ncbi:TPA: hypothetical protein PMD70_003309 [Vibrio cholerae]|nr:hypothetical protein [Vibrio cholerae]HDI3160441.1 hypothetical protein [Vibrio cholerae]HDI3293943.1 hypothetical protein [Vibrio cholerae]